MGQLAEELLVRALLGAAIEDHVAEFLLLARLDLHFEQFVGALLIVQRRLDRQIDGPAESHDVRLRRVDDRRRLRLGCETRTERDGNFEIITNTRNQKSSEAKKD